MAWSDPNTFVGPKQSSSFLSGVGSFLDSPYGKLGITGLGTLLDAQDSKANRDANLASSAADRASREKIAQMQLQQNGAATAMNDARARAQGVLDANPLGAEQNYAAKAAFMRAAAPMFSNISFHPSDPGIASAMPGVSGGFSISPDFASQMQAAWSPDKVLSAIAQRQMDSAALNPSRGSAGTMGTLGLGDASGYQSQVNNYASQQQQQQEALRRALDNNPTGQKATGTTATNPETLFNQNFDAIAQAKQYTGDWEKAYQVVTGQKWPDGKGITVDANGGHMANAGHGFWGTLGKIATVAAPIVAAPFTGGLSLAAIGAGAGAANGLLNGGGLKGALVGGALGGATAGLGGGAGAGMSKTAALKQALLNPRTISNVAAQTLPGTAGQVAGMANMGLNLIPRRS